MFEESPSARTCCSFFGGFFWRKTWLGMVKYPCTHPSAIQPFISPYCLSSSCSPAYPHHNRLPRLEGFSECSRVFCFVCHPNAYARFNLFDLRFTQYPNFFEISVVCAISACFFPILFQNTSLCFLVQRESV